MRVNLIFPIPLLIELVELILNFLIMKQRKSVRLLLSDLQRSVIEHRCTRQGKKSEIMLKYVQISPRKDTLLLEANNLVNGNNDVKFCFVDINCRLKIKWEDELRPDSFFSLLEDLKGKLQVNQIYNFFLQICCFIVRVYYWFLISVIFIFFGTRIFRI